MCGKVSRLVRLVRPSSGLEWSIQVHGWEALVLSLDTRLVKGASHKYLRRVPYTDSKGRRRYRYFYNVSGGKGHAHDDQFVVGAAFYLKDDDKDGHIHVMAVDGDMVTIRHDESGKVEKINKKDLQKRLQDKHAEDVTRTVKGREVVHRGWKSTREKLRQQLRDVMEFGSEKQKARLRERASRAGVSWEDVKAAVDRKKKDDEPKGKVGALVDRVREKSEDTKPTQPTTKPPSWLGIEDAKKVGKAWELSDGSAKVEYTPKAKNKDAHPKYTVTYKTPVGEGGYQTELEFYTREAAATAMQELNGRTYWDLNDAQKEAIQGFIDDAGDSLGYEQATDGTWGAIEGAQEKALRPILEKFLNEKAKRFLEQQREGQSPFDSLEEGRRTWHKVITDRVRDVLKEIHRASSKVRPVGGFASDLDSKIMKGDTKPDPERVVSAVRDFRSFVDALNSGRSSELVAANWYAKNGRVPAREETLQTLWNQGFKVVKGKDSGAIKNVLSTTWFDWAQSRQGAENLAEHLRGAGYTLEPHGFFPVRSAYQGVIDHGAQVIGIEERRTVRMIRPLVESLKENQKVLEKFRPKGLNEAKEKARGSMRGTVAAVEAKVRDHMSRMGGAIRSMDRTKDVYAKNRFRAIAIEQFAELQALRDSNFSDLQAPKKEFSLGASEGKTHQQLWLRGLDFVKGKSDNNAKMLPSDMNFPGLPGNGRKIMLEDMERNGLKIVPKGIVQEDTRVDAANHPVIQAFAGVGLDNLTPEQSGKNGHTLRMDMLGGRLVDKGVPFGVTRIITSTVNNFFTGLALDAANIQSGDVGDSGVSVRDTVRNLKHVQGIKEAGEGALTPAIKGTFKVQGEALTIRAKQVAQLHFAGYTIKPGKMSQAEYKGLMDDFKKLRASTASVSKESALDLVDALANAKTLNHKIVPHGKFPTLFSHSGTTGQGGAGFTHGGVPLRRGRVRDDVDYGFVFSPPEVPSEIRGGARGVAKVLRQYVTDGVLPKMGVSLRQDGTRVEITRPGMVTHDDRGEVTPEWREVVAHFSALMDAAGVPKPYLSISGEVHSPVTVPSKGFVMERFVREPRTNWERTAKYSTVARLTAEESKELTSRGYSRTKGYFASGNGILIKIERPKTSGGPYRVRVFSEGDVSAQERSDQSKLLDAYGEVVSFMPPAEKTPRSMDEWDKRTDAVDLFSLREAMQSAIRYAIFHHEKTNQPTKLPKNVQKAVDDHVRDLKKHNPNASTSKLDAAIQAGDISPDRKDVLMSKNDKRIFDVRDHLDWHLAGYKVVDGQMSGSDYAKLTKKLYAMQPPSGTRGAKGLRERQKRFVVNAKNLMDAGYSLVPHGKWPTMFENKSKVKKSQARVDGSRRAKNLSCGPVGRLCQRLRN